MRNLLITTINMGVEGRGGEGEKRRERLLRNWRDKIKGKHRIESDKQKPEKRGGRIEKGKRNPAETETVDKHGFLRG